MEYLQAGVFTYALRMGFSPLTTSMARDLVLQHRARTSVEVLGCWWLAIKFEEEFEKAGTLKEFTQGFTPLFREQVRTFEKKRLLDGPIPYLTKVRALSNELGDRTDNDVLHALVFSDADLWPVDWGRHLRAGRSSPLLAVIGSLRIRKRRRTFDRVLKRVLLPRLKGGA